MRNQQDSVNTQGGAMSKGLGSLTWFGVAASRGCCWASGGVGFLPDHQRGQGSSPPQLPHTLLPALHLGFLHHHRRGTLGKHRHRYEGWSRAGRTTTCLRNPTGLVCGIATLHCPANQLCKEQQQLYCVKIMCFYCIVYHLLISRPSYPNGLDLI